MRQCHGAQRQLLVGPRDEIFIEAEVAADDEEKTIDPLISVLLQPFREGLAGGGRATLVENDESPTGFELTQQLVGLEPQRSLRVLLATPGRSPHLSGGVTSEPPISAKRLLRVPSVSSPLSLVKTMS